MTTSEMTTEVHNVWTIHGMNPDGTKAEQPLATLSRPQDWGHPRWHYEYFRLEWKKGGVSYINNFHGWTDLQLPASEYPMLFASLIVQILMPGCLEQWCGKAYRNPDDFWDMAWGRLPPLWEEEEEEDGDWYGDEYDTIGHDALED